MAGVRVVSLYDNGHGGRIEEQEHQEMDRNGKEVCRLKRVRCFLRIDYFWEDLDMCCPYSIRGLDPEEYVIVLNMISAYLEDYMPYGLLLTAVFDLHHVSKTSPGFVEHSLVERLVNDQVPISQCKPQPVPKIIIPDVNPKFSPNNHENIELKNELEKLKIDFITLSNAHKEVLTRLEFLEKKVSGNGKLIKSIDTETAKLYEEELVNELVGVGIDIDEKAVHLPELKDMPDNLGFVAD